MPIRTGSLYVRADDLDPARIPEVIETDLLLPDPYVARPITDDSLIQSDLSEAEPWMSTLNDRFEWENPLPMIVTVELARPTKFD
jgi:hypothetical protein